MEGSSPSKFLMMIELEVNQFIVSREIELIPAGILHTESSAVRMRGIGKQTTGGESLIEKLKFNQ